MMVFLIFIVLTALVIYGIVSEQPVFFALAAVLFVVGLISTAVSSAAYNKDCAAKGGVVVDSQHDSVCIDKSAIIELK